MVFSEERYMKLALELAVKGEGKVSPNPMVGAVIVKDSRIIGSGYHEKYGEFHAERNAVMSCDEDMHGADMYVTLEPCCHYGKTPPCTEAIIESGIKKVFVGCTDGNPIVENKGIDILRKNGIEVIVGVLEKECRKLNEIFFHYIKCGRPFVIMKYAMTADGKIASYTGHSKWITGELARKHVHKIRNRVSGIMAGIGTVLADDPLLTCRIEGGVNPTRIICDSSLKIPYDCNIIKTAGDVKTYIAVSQNHDEEKRKRLEDLGAEFIICGKEQTDIKEILNVLGKKKIDSVLIEGGGKLNFSALSANTVNKVYSYIAPKILGGENAKTPVEGLGLERADRPFNLKMERIEMLGDDIFIEYDVVR